MSREVQVRFCESRAVRSRPATHLDRDVVDVESHLGDRYLEQESHVLLYLRIFDSVSHRSLEPAPSRDLIDKIIQTYSRSKDGEWEA